MALDFISAFLEYTSDSLSPPIFRKWTAIGGITAAVERRVCTITTLGQMYPNMYILLVGSPGVGKTVAIDAMIDIWRAAKYGGDPHKRFHIAPKRMSRAGLIDALVEADRKLLVNGELIEFHSLIVPSAELGVLISAHDLDFLSVLNDLYDNPAIFGEKLRWVNAGKTTDIIFPQINLLAGTQPVFLGSVLPDEAWSQGFTSRLLLIYSALVQRVPDLFAKRDPRTAQKQALVDHIIELSKMHGLIEWEPAAGARFQELYHSNFAPVPEHYRLSHYTSRRMAHMLKLCQASSLSRGFDMKINVDDVNRALGLMHEAEVPMPDIFREMSHKSDSTILDEMFNWMYKLYTKEKEPISGYRIRRLLVSNFQVPSERVEKIIGIAEKSNMITIIAGTDTFTPNAKHRHAEPN